MHFYCMRYPERRVAMHRYMYMIRSMEQSATPGAWLGYDRVSGLAPSQPFFALASSSSPILSASHCARLVSQCQGLRVDLRGISLPQRARCLVMPGGRGVQLLSTPGPRRPNRSFERATAPISICTVHVNAFQNVHI